MRTLDTATLDQAARDYAGFFMQANRRSKTGQSWVSGPERIKQDFHAFTFKDEFDYVLERIRDELGKNAKAQLDEIAKQVFTPRQDKVFEDLLAEHLAITPDGDHIEGRIGKVQLGNRVVGRYAKVINARRGAVVLPKASYWPIYAGEGDERIRPGGGVADPLPDGAEPLPLGANVTNISAEAAIAAVDAIADRLDEGDAAANIRGRTGTQPVDPDATETGTLLFTLPCSDPAVSGGVDDTDGTVSATFDTITDDSSADATGTLGYCRAAAVGTGADDHIDGNAATSDAAFVFNTVSIVSGSTVSMTSAVIGLSQGSTAT